MDILREPEPSYLRNGVDLEVSAPRKGSGICSAPLASQFNESSRSLVLETEPRLDSNLIMRWEAVADYNGSLFPVKTVNYAFVKRAFDLVVSAIVLAVLSPVMLLVAILVKCTSRGTVFFTQTRVGRGGRHFNCYKFRSMCSNAEEIKGELKERNEATGPVFKMKHDPRVTPIGRWLRKWSIDELPQLWNVLNGDMSLVGPRPPIPTEVCTYGERERMRLAVKPGITCLWQVSGRSDIGFERWVQLDIHYIETMSFWNDIKILFLTVPAVITCRGAR